MASSDTKDNGEQLSEKALEGLLDEEDKSTTEEQNAEQLSEKDSGGLLDEEDKSTTEGQNADQLSEKGLEGLLDEEDRLTPQEEKAEEFSGMELDEPEEEPGKAIPEEEGAEKFSGKELEGLKEEVSETIPEEEKVERIWEKFREKKRLSLGIAIGLCLLTGFVSFFWIKGQRGKTPQFDIQRFAIPGEQLFIFQPFIIPFKKNKKFTYISLSISFNLPNKKLKEEIIGKKEQIRGIIFDILREEINKTKEVPSIEKIKGFIIRGMNIALSTGKVNKVYITQFLAV